ncbi:MAG: hypothetical protein WCU00_07020 [Candidatus Latescibacterota bacterium]
MGTITVTKTKSIKTLAEKYPPSVSCSCKICVDYCLRPGWWTVEEAAKAFSAGHGNRMMLEMAPERTFVVLSPAFKGCELDFSRQIHASRGCTFLTNNLCELFGSGFQPLECRFCHHDRPGQGKECHADIEKDWNTPSGKALVVTWSKITGFWNRMGRGRIV